METTIYVICSYLAISFLSFISSMWMESSNFKTADAEEKVEIIIGTFVVALFWFPVTLIMLIFCFRKQLLHLFKLGKKL